MWLLTIVFLAGGVVKTNAVIVGPQGGFVPHGCHNVRDYATRYAEQHDVKVLAATCGRAKGA
ncbi:hypothetical protein RsoP1IDN_10 [Ralstonia phage RsoP1IDN]|uniref:Uncharacterized protein n=1 Tax=Ralstonia phage RsoP1IDN TaxID=2060091 RepID=A0A2P0VPE9_9CAUD|nr:hypothetical protein HOS84_gp10 [Ralstonia phage RsoP1IDN]AUG85412.1 hypothetical protein RsoP1IDN_10 [Ralstonia phage RsoP1IDN]